MQAGGKGVNGFLENTRIKITSKFYYYQNYGSTNIYAAISECNMFFIYILTVPNVFII